ncbi:KRRI-Interacting protein 1 [Myotisia sp. PD_48]|nr:KRRI-Interacting protein 1 [Myotisia sp. PD_48]
MRAQLLLYPGCIGLKAILSFGKNYQRFFDTSPIMGVDIPSRQRKKVLFEDEASGDENGDDFSGEGVANSPGPKDFEFSVNKEYASRFEHNKKREELQHLEAKLGKRPINKRAGYDESDGSVSSDSEEEDDAAELVTEALDSEILATLNAIKSKDPRVYDPNTKFYTLDAEKEATASATEKSEKPMFLRDYHRENLLRGQEIEEDGVELPKTYAEEQEDLKQAIVKEMHAAADEEAFEGDEGGKGDDNGFLVRKEKTRAPTKSRPQITETDVMTADKDPEHFLSNFMASRAWVSTNQSSFQPFESDDDEEVDKADALEEAYNFRFEDPNKLNETLTTHARDTIAKFSVRREAQSSRKRQREAEREKKEEEKKQRDEARARLRKLKIDELETKVAKIKKASGLKSVDVSDHAWSQFLEDGWEDDKWDAEMKKRFGEEYYAANEESNSDGDDDGSQPSKSKRRKLKKPTWDDDIDIQDLVPGFDDEGNMDEDLPGNDEPEENDGPAKKSKKKMLQDKREMQTDAKRERRKIERLVDNSLNLEASLLPGSSKKFSGTFRYRESSPVSYGLTAKDILLADDVQLNQFAGLKKLASFRDPDKKRRDHKRLGKKARLRQWRKDTFGNEAEPSIPEMGPDTADSAPNVLELGETGVDIREGKKKKRKRSKKN